MSTKIEALLRRITDASLAEELRAAVAEQQPRREFGLVFERHLPETVELPGLPVRTGTKVRILPKRGSTEAPSGIVWQVAALDGSIAELVTLDGEQTERRGVIDLVRVADFADAIYPGLVSTDRLQRDDADRPWHALINAENYHALLALQFTHAGSIDTIYIDPPYNTGNDDWIYADRHVNPEDGFRHSKWLSFMERRLDLARRLLKPTGVIIVAIGDDEHHRLRMLLDQVFGEQNFIANSAWQGNTKNDARFVGGGMDYMLIYAKDAAALVAADVKWRVPKEGVDEVIEQGHLAWEASEHDSVKASRLLAGWWAKNKARFDPGLGDNVKVDIDGTVIRISPLDWPGGGGPRYDVIHPVTGQPVAIPKNGWRIVDPAKMQAEIGAGRVLFGPDHTSGIRRKTPLLEMTERSVSPSFQKDRRAAARYLEGVLGDKRFPFPKDHHVLMRWIGMVTPANGTVLDFFGGSGSTLEAVLRLNAVDGGRRQCILVTNNEVGSKTERDMRKRGLRDGDAEWESAGVCEYVTKPRMRTILTGVRPDGSEYADLVSGNVEMFDLTYEDPAMVELDLAFGRIAPLLWLMAGGRGHRIDEVAPAGWATTDAYGVLFNTDAQAAFLAAMAYQTHAFIVTDDEAQFQLIASLLPPACRAVRLYESYLRTFQINTPGA